MNHHYDITREDIKQIVKEIVQFLDKFLDKHRLAFMCACFPWQGCRSWESSRDMVQKRLEEIRAYSIRYVRGSVD